MAELAPGDLNRVFFTNGGSESVESALKLSRQYHRLGQAEQVQGDRAGDRLPRHHFGALSATGVPDSAPRSSR